MNSLDSQSRQQSKAEQAFTLTDLLAVIAVILVLVCFRFTAFAAGKDRNRVVQCAANLRQFALAMHIYGNEYGDKLPSSNSGFWAWDLNWNAGTFVERTGARWNVMYCPGTKVRFTEQENAALYNFAPGTYHVSGYANTFPGATVLTTNQNATLNPQSAGAGLSIMPPPPASQRVLLADATISNAGQNNEALRYTYNYTSIVGGYAKPHISAHLNGNIPAGGNLAMLDGRVEWRKFQDMHVRTSGAAPVFWW